MKSKKISLVIMAVIFSLSLLIPTSTFSIFEYNGKINLIEKEYVVHLKNRHFIPAKGISNELKIKMNKLSSEGVYAITQFDYLPSNEEKRLLDERDMKLLAYVPNKAWYAYIPKDKVNEIMMMPFVRSIDVISPEYKISPKLQNGVVDSWAFDVYGNVILIVELHEDVPLYEGEQLVSSIGGIVHNRIELANALTVSVPYDSISQLSKEEIVQWIEGIAPNPTFQLDQSRDNVGVGGVQNPPYSLDGDGINLLVYDDGEIDESHPDLSNRVIIGEECAIYTHATRVAGVIAGNGTLDYNIRGMVPKAILVSYQASNTTYNSTNDLEEEYNESINKYNVSIASNSWVSSYEDGSIVCGYLGNYTIRSELLDKIVRGSLGKPIPVVFSAGNTRDENQPCGNYNTIATPTTAKNIITVGATNSNDDSVTDFTAWGPVSDNRTKPDVVAPGCQVGGDEGINTTDAVYSFISVCGTSFAAPHVSGTLALMLQQYKITYNNETPLPSTLKALLIHTAKDINNTGPDYTSGYGRINATSAVDFVRDKSLIESDLTNNNETDSYQIFITPSEDELKVTLVWDDPAAQPFVSKTLVNDLNLKLIAPNGSEYYPWVLDANNPSQPATTGVDDINNVEQVVVNDPKPGTWTVEVSGKVAVGNEQNYSLVGPFAFMLEGLELILSEDGMKIFRFFVINNRNENLTNINWTFDAGVVFDSVNYPTSLSSGKGMFVFFEHNFTDGDIYEINATATSGNDSDSETMTLTIGDIIAYDLREIYVNGRERIFRFKILNHMNETQTVNWTLNTEAESILANNLTTIHPGNETFVYVHYNYTSGGSYTVYGRANNGTIIDFTNFLDINVS